MKEYRTRHGDRRLWFEPAEIETITLDELARADALPAPNDPDLTVDIERFLERHLRANLDRHADLPTDVLGVTTFVPAKPPRVEINRELSGTVLDEDDPLPGHLGRWRATLAHEAAHILLHRTLYELDDLQRALFPAEPSPDAERQRHLMRCLKRDLGAIGASDWREVQANRGMAALLMPRALFLSAAQHALEGDKEALRPGTARHSAVVEILGRRFSVSRQAASIRIEALGLLTPGGQQPLSLS